MVAAISTNVWYKNSMTMNWSNSFLVSWYDSRLSARMLGGSPSTSAPFVCSRNKQRYKKQLNIVTNELGGQYEETFNDVKRITLNCFTYKAVRTVLHQLYEMNPTEYMWLYNFVAANDPRDGKKFLRVLGKEKQDLAERVMITRLHLYGKWIKVCDHAEIYKEISDENLSLMRERLLETIVWPSDDTNAGKSE
ncbi:chaperonin-like RbcX protein 2, chloroplastic [Heracleum sosnowskyi]|uniref:Chaperonin-like RbcX protein 2, chloroplastic n=1 Tax=Heracleum sosnowskyi TaxID=360622 RepID=A0AAD8HNG5_9APIA|nr:chaperonin-like RbcX protein 2, chloroplastic [Heracleum sosnowskyi]